MKKAFLLGGAARIVKEPTAAERQIAMLRFLADSGVIEHMPRPIPAQTRRENPEDPFKAIEARETAWIGDQLASDIAALGGGPQIEKVTYVHGFWNVAMLQWQANGIAARIVHEFKFERRKYREPHDEAKLRRAVSGRFSKMLARQAEQVRMLGEPRLSNPEDIDLTRFRIDMPLAAMLKATYPDAGSQLRKGLALNNEYIFRSESYNGRRNQAEGVKSVHLSLGRELIRGEFTLVVKGAVLKWSKGSLSIMGMDLPDTLWTGCVGRRLEDIFEHPWFAGDMRITAISPTRRDGVDGWALTVKGSDGPLPVEW